MDVMEKRFKRGLILGKFLPIHFGHMYLIQQGSEQCDNLTVLACSLKSEPIPGYLRYRWVLEYCNKLKDKNTTVINITDELPQYPEEHPDFWNIWCNLVKQYEPDVIFSSEDYGLELARRLNIEHILVDKKRIKFPISGTKIRKKPYENWDMIYPGARPHFVDRIYFLGPESTGKTTATEMMSEYFKTSHIPEYGRILWERNSGEISLYDFCEIVVMQRDIENKIIRNSNNKFLFCDTETITTKVFCELYHPGEHKNLDNFFDHHIQRQLENRCHFFVLSPDVPAVQDGTRTFLEHRHKHFKMILSELNKWNIPYVVLEGNYNERLDIVKEYEKNLDSHKCTANYQIGTEI